MLPPILETDPPFIIKVYDTYFLVLWDNCIETPEDKYLYEKIVSVTIKRGKPELNVLGIALKFLIRAYFHSGNTETDEIIIKFRSGEIISRYVHGEVSEKVEEAIELIQSKLNSRKYQLSNL